MGAKILIRPAAKDDLSAIVRVAEATGMFLGEELAYFTDQINACVAGEPSGAANSTPSLIVASQHDGDCDTVIGAAYFAPETMAQGVHNLLFIGVLTDARRDGAGKALLCEFETAAKNAGARLAVIETASDTMFEPAWRLYERNGYLEEARVRDYYDQGLDKLIFSKRFVK